MKHLLTFAVCLSICANCVAQQDIDKLLAESNPAIQQQLEAIGRVVRPSESLSSNVEALREIQKLKELTDDEAELVKQVAIFSMAAGEETKPMLAGAILQYLAPRSRVTIRTLAPYLDSKNPQLRSFVRDWFRGHDNADSIDSGAVNYKEYSTYVSWSVNRGEEIPAPFIKYIYERSPGQALQVFATGTTNLSDRLKALRMGYDARQQGRELTEQQREKIRQIQAKSKQMGRERRQILLAEHIISNAIWLHKHGFVVRFNEALPEAMDGLKKLANHEEWWARLYVAYIMRQNLALRDDATLRQLTEDENKLVSEVASSKDE